MFEFAQRHGVGVEVGNLFKLERRLRRDGQHVSASEKEEVLVCREFFGDALDFQRVAKYGFENFGQFRKLVQSHAVFSKILSALDGVKEGQEHHGGELRRKGLGRSYSDFGSGAGEEPEIGQTRYRRSYHVDDAEGFASLRLDELERLDGVCRFARLRDENVERLGVDPYRAIEKFARDFGGGGHSGVFSKRVGSCPT